LSRIIEELSFIANWEENIFFVDIIFGVLARKNQIHIQKGLFFAFSTKCKFYIFGQPHQFSRCSCSVITFKKSITTNNQKYYFSFFPELFCGNFNEMIHWKYKFSKTLRVKIFADCTVKKNLNPSRKSLSNPITKSTTQNR